MADLEQVGSDAPAEGGDTGSEFAGLETFEMNDDTGELEAKFSPPEEPEAAADDVDEPAGDAPAEDSADTYEKRYNDLRAEFDRRNSGYQQAERIAEENAKLRAIAGRLLAERKGKPASAADDDGEVDYLEVFSDPRRGREFLNSFGARIAASVRAEVMREFDEFRPALIETNLSREAREALIEHPDIPQYYELMDKVYDMFPDQEIPIARAYQIAKKMASLIPGSSTEQPRQETPASAETTRARVPATELRERAARYETETGVASAAGDRPTKPAAQSVKDAFDQALAEMASGG